MSVLFSKACALKGATNSRGILDRCVLFPLFLFQGLCNQFGPHILLLGKACYVLHYLHKYW